jgi:ankyrin repeat protein
MNIEEFKDEFLGKDSDLQAFKLPTPQSLTNPFESNSQAENALTLPTPTTLLTPFGPSTTTPFKSSSSSSNGETATSNSSNGNQQQQSSSDPAAATQIDSPATFMNKIIQNQMFGATESKYAYDEVDNFLGGLDSSSFSLVSPWGPGGFNTPNKPHNPFQQQQGSTTQQNVPPVIPPTMLQHPASLNSKSPSPNSPPSATSDNSPQQYTMPIPSLALINPPNFTASASPNGLIRLIEGFNKPLKDKQIGGKDNTKHCIPTQIIELCTNKLPPNSDPAVLSVRASVLGFDRVSRTKVILGHISDKAFEEKGAGSNARWLSVFDDILVQFSSHNNGQKLALRFQLLDADKKPVCHVDTYEFETITKRGLEKIKERQKRKRSDSDLEAVAEAVEPPVGFSTGGQLVRIVGKGFISPPVSQAKVLFGEKEAREIHSIKRTYIVCETPEHEVGKVDVSVQLDKKGPLASNATFTFIDTNDQEGIQEMVQHMSRPSQHSNSQEETSAPTPKKVKKSDGEKSNGSASKKKNGNASSRSLAAFASGEQRDVCGYSLIHHTCARGYFELTALLLENNVCDIDQVDNYGRSALFWAMWAKDTALVTYLISKGADPTLIDDAGDSFLHMAVDHDTDNDENVNDIHSLLHWMSLHLSPALLSALLKHKNNSGLTVKELALQNEDFELVELFASVVRPVVRTTIPCSFSVAQQLNPDLSHNLLLVV